MKTNKEIEDLEKSILNDFKEIHGLEIDRPLIGQWCKEIAMDNAKKHLYATISDLPICEILRLKSKLEGKPTTVKEAEPINVTSTKEAPRSTNTTKKVKGKAKEDKAQV